MSRTCSVPSPFGATLTKADRERMLAEADPLIRAFVVKSGLPRDHRDDAMQEARLKVWECSVKFDPARSKWVTYAVAITKRVILREYQDGAMGDRDRPGQLADDADEWLLGQESGERDHDEGNEPDEDATPNALGEAVRRQLGEPLLAKLNDRSREIVELIAFEGLTPDQVAVRLGMAVKDVKLYVRNAAATIQGKSRKPKAGGLAKMDRRSPGRPFAPHDTRIIAALAAHPDWPLARVHRELSLPGSASTFARHVRRLRAKVGNVGESVPPPAEQEPATAPTSEPTTAPMPIPEPAKRAGRNGWNYWRRLVPGSARMLLADAVRNRRR